MSDIYVNMTRALDLLVASAAPIRMTFPPEHAGGRSGARDMLTDFSPEGMPQNIYFQTQASAEKAAELLGIPATIERVQQDVPEGVFPDERTLFIRYGLAVPQDEELWKAAYKRAQDYAKAQGVQEAPSQLDTLLDTPVAKLPKDKTILMVGSGVVSRVIPFLLKEEGFHVETVPSLDQAAEQVDMLARQGKQVVHMLVADTEEKNISGFAQQVAAGEVSNLTRFTKVEPIGEEAVFENGNATDAGTLNVRLRTSIIGAALRATGEDVPDDLQERVSAKAKMPPVSALGRLAAEGPEGFRRRQ